MQQGWLHAAGMAVAGPSTDPPPPSPLTVVLGIVELVVRRSVDLTPTPLRAPLAQTAIHRGQEGVWWRGSAKLDLMSPPSNLMRLTLCDMDHVAGELGHAMS